MLEVSNVKLSLDAGSPGLSGEGLTRTAAADALGISEESLRSVRVLKRSVDARKKRDVHFVATLGVAFFDEAAEAAVLARACDRDGAGAVAGTQVKPHKPYESLIVPMLGGGADGGAHDRPIVVGSGPAGLFAALYLARAGLRPLLIERGGDVRERLRAVAAFEGDGVLDAQTNIQFGEGGAGTFSDGKLTTNVKNPLTPHVLQWFVDAGAPEEIRWQAKPHIGTDLLTGVVRRLREQIIEAGGEVRFHTQLSGLGFRNGALEGVDVHDTHTGVVEHIGTHRVVLACGHSARDTFELVYEAGIRMEQKPFSVGVRIEHEQAVIDRTQYGAAAQHPALGAADYKLAVHLPGGRSVYTFCMCPGGQVVCAASEDGGVVVNGMSRFARDGRNANSALLVGVGPGDFGGDHPLAGVELQRHMERAAYQAAITAGGVPYTAPAQRVGDFLAGRVGNPSESVCPTYARGVAWCDLRACLPPFVARALAEALPLLDRKLSGFAAGDAVMTGVETRSSSPVRMMRDENGEALLRDGRRGTGLYPCGEGAGYAGGIMSAAVDGLRVAQWVAVRLSDGR